MKGYIENLLAIVIALATCAMLVVFSWCVWAWLAPRSETVRRETYEESRAYREGVVREVESARTQYLTAPRESRAAIRAYVLSRVTDFPDDALPDYLRPWVDCLRGADQGACQ